MVWPFELVNMKGFYIEVTNELLEKKHIEAVGPAIWVFLWCLDKITSINENGVGKVLGGKPIKRRELTDALGFSTKDISRHLLRLKTAGYINLLRTPFGYVITVNKAKKVFKKRTQRVDKNVSSLGSEETKMSPSDETKMSTGRDKNVSSIGRDKNVSNKEDNSSIDNTKTIQYIPFPSEKGTELKKEKIQKEPTDYGLKKDGSQILPTEIDSVIGLFLTIVPADFAGKNSAFAKMPTRMAVAEFLKRKTVAEAEAIVKEYGERFASGEEFCPTIGNVHEFFVYKLAKIEHFLGRRQQASTRVIPGEVRGDFNRSHAKQIAKINEEAYHRTRKMYKQLKDQKDLSEFYKLNREKFHLDNLDDVE